MLKMNLTVEKVTSCSLFRTLVSVGISMHRSAYAPDFSPSDGYTVIQPDK